MIEHAVSLAADLGAAVSTESTVPLVKSFNRAYSVGARDALSNLCLWGFFHTDCIFESAAALVSLHHTKVGAYRAMNRHQWLEWDEIQRGQRPQRAPGLGRERGRKAYVYEASHIGPLEVQP
ncbi:hypothetical protein [Comamonas sp. JUb58]|uniref:hypothetical protein n=1 Tax=Comamonas sp. JUb58 TaxID=2485114 RepID=UPI00105EAC5E|nr:hypothetical protein [Comamonas sp. JUb58]TDS74375.1 hypothetical protein EDF71_11755 [Comamonas sp. JUb58]